MACRTILLAVIARFPCSMEEVLMRWSDGQVMSLLVALHTYSTCRYQAGCSIIMCWLQYYHVLKACSSRTRPAAQEQGLLLTNKACCSQTRPSAHEEGLPLTNKACSSRMRSAAQEFSAVVKSSTKSSCWGPAAWQSCGLTKNCVVRRICCAVDIEVLDCGADN